MTRRCALRLPARTLTDARFNSATSAFSSATSAYSMRMIDGVRGAHDPGHYASQAPRRQLLQLGYCQKLWMK